MRFRMTAPLRCLLAALGLTAVLPATALAQGRTEEVMDLLPLAAKAKAAYASAVETKKQSPAAGILRP